MTERKSVYIREEVHALLKVEFFHAMGELTMGDLADLAIVDSIAKNGRNVSNRKSAKAIAAKLL